MLTNQSSFDMLAHMPKKTTKYQFVKDELLRLIYEDKGLPGGAMLPSENALVQQFGVSLITVRRALGDLASENIIYTRKGKGSFVKEVSPNNQKEKSITIIIPTATAEDTVFTLLQGMQTYLTEKNYMMKTFFSGMHIEEEQKYLQNFLDNGNDGLICFSLNPELNYPLLKKMLNTGRHFVLIDRGLEHHEMTNFVACDNYSGGFQAAELLINLGHQNIAFISVFADVSAEKLRLDGYRDALKNANIEPRPEFTIHVNNTNKLPQFIKKYGITAFQCVNDFSASIIMRTLTEAGFRIPEDISIFGFDNSVICRHMPVKLSTVVQPFYEIGATAAKLLDETIEKNLRVKSQFFLPVELKLRNSHGPKPAAR